MVCGTKFVGNNGMPAPGVWTNAENKGVNTNAEQVWPYPIITSVQCFGTWMEPSQHLVASPAILEGTMLQSEAGQYSESPDAMSVRSAESSSVHSAESAPESQRKQSAARAAKRQRQRERRKQFRAPAQAETQIISETALVKLTQKFDWRAAAVAAEFKLVVNRTFFDVFAEDELSSDNDAPLPTPFFETTWEIDQFRRQYRRFRLGHHQGVKGERRAKLPCAEGPTLVLDGRRGAPTHTIPVAAMAA